MASYTNKLAELKKTLAKKDKQIANLQENIKTLTAKRAEDMDTLHDLRNQLEYGIKDLQEAMKEVYLKSFCEEYGEPVLDDETKELLGKRIVFRALRKNNYKLNLSEELIVPEDEKYISKITVGLTYTAEEEGGKDDEGQQV